MGTDLDIHVLRDIARALTKAAGLGVGEIEVGRETLELPKWPRDLAGMRVAVVADLHAGGPQIDEERIDRIVERVNTEAVDLVALLGDYIDPTVTFGKWIEPEKIGSRLARIESRLGTYAVLGNHDWSHAGARMGEALRGAGITLLENRAIAIDARSRGREAGPPAGAMPVAGAPSGPAAAIPEARASSASPAPQTGAPSGATGAMPAAHAPATSAAALPEAGAPSTAAAALPEARAPSTFAGAFWIAGLGDLTKREADLDGTLAQVQDDAPVLLFSHNPDVFPRVPPRVALTLSGHTHGAQVDLPVLRDKLTPSRFGARYTGGHIEEDGRHLYVSDGIGTSRLPIRFRAKPSLPVLELQPSTSVSH